VFLQRHGIATLYLEKPAFLKLLVHIFTDFADTSLPKIKQYAFANFHVGSNSYCSCCNTSAG
jgi:hypothetical protein